MKPGQVVVDLAPRPAPGASTCGAASRLPARPARALEGTIIALDIPPMEPIEGVQFILGDFREDAAAQQLARRWPAAGGPGGL